MTHPDGTNVQESLAFKYLGQLKERQGAHKEVSARIAGPLETWRTLKGKIFRCKRLAVALRIRLYESLATSKLMSAAATIPLSKSELKRMEVIRTSHLRQILRVPYTAHVTNKVVRATCKRPSVESLLHLDRLRLWGAACRDQTHGYFLSTLFGMVAEKILQNAPRARLRTELWFNNQSSSSPKSATLLTGPLNLIFCLTHRWHGTSPPLPTLFQLGSCMTGRYTYPMHGPIRLIRIRPCVPLAQGMLACN